MKSLMQPRSMTLAVLPRWREEQFWDGASLVAQRPSFWIEFGSRLGKALVPLAWRYVSNGMPPEEEAAWREAERRGQGDEWLKERWRRSSDR